MRLLYLFWSVSWVEVFLDASIMASVFIAQSGVMKNIYILKFSIDSLRKSCLFI